MQKRLKDFFIPHEGNTYAPHSLQKAAMVGMVFLIVLSFTASNVLSLLWLGSQWMLSSVLPAVIVDLTNEERSADSLGTLKRNAVLDEAAKLKAADMAKNEYFAHYSPTGVSPWHWFDAVSYDYVHAGENLAIYFTDSKDVVDAWMASPSHRANILNGNYTEIGVGTAEGEYEGFHTVYVVQLFGTPAASVSRTTPSAAAPQPVAVANAAEPAGNRVLAESVSVPEQKSEETAAPAPSAAEPALVPEENAQTSSPSSGAAPEIVSETESQPSAISNISVSEMGPVAYSDLMATSVPNKVAAPAGLSAPAPQEDAPFMARLLTQPHRILQLLYIVIGAFVLVSLLLSIIIEVRRQQPLQIAYGFGLLLLMAGLFTVHILISGGALIA
jgi:hypothetical protein